MFERPKTVLALDRAAVETGDLQNLQAKLQYLNEFKITHILGTDGPLSIKLPPFCQWRDLTKQLNYFSGMRTFTRCILSYFSYFIGLAARFEVSKAMNIQVVLWVVTSYFGRPCCLYLQGEGPDFHLLHI
jgi:hypothetical protein